MNFPSAIAATAPLVSGDYRDERAPDIAAGNAFGNSVTEALLEEDTRKRLREMDPVVVTGDEVKASRLRRVAIETTQAQVTHGMGNAAILAAITNLTNSIDSLNDRIDAQGDRIDAQGDRIEAQGARVQNMRRREKMRNGIWSEILVEFPGRNPVGVAPANQPTSRELVFTMSKQDIEALEAAFNLPVGRLSGYDTAAARRNAVMEYLTEG